jgi:endonuclease/exonuclease/phosphatase family metal-dependent hydrolase
MAALPDGHDGQTAFFGAIPATADTPRIAPDLRPEDLVLDTDPAPVPVPDGIPVRVVTWNLWDGRITDPDAVGAVLAALHPDVVALEETPDDFVQPIAAAAGFPYAGGDRQGDTALLSRTRLDDFAIVGLGNGWGYVHAFTEIGGRRLSVYAAHISWNLRGAEQCRAFANDHVGRDPTPDILVAGDFNDEHLSVHNKLLETQLTDALAVSGLYPGQRISWPAFGFDESEGSQLIDIVFYKSIMKPLVGRTDVLNLQPPLSDHKPVVVDLLYPRQRPFTTDPLARGRDPWRELPPPEERPVNRLRNPGAEGGGAGWTLRDGATAVLGERESQRPHGGLALFAGYPAEAARRGAVSSGAQLVDLADQAAVVDDGRGQLLVSGWMATGYQRLVRGDVVGNRVVPYDDGEIIVELLDADGRLIGRESSGRRDTLDWTPYAHAIPVPPGTRAARLTWASHRKPQAGAGSDAVFDDLYVGLRALDAPHGRVGGNLLGDGGAESGGLAGWDASGWKVVRDLSKHGPWGRLDYAPWTWSGARMFAAAGPRRATMRRTVALGAHAGELALRWGGHVRTLGGRADVTVSLEILEADGRVWGRLSRHTWAPEWTALDSLTRIPPGAAAARLVVEADLPRADAAAFADELYVIPERLPADHLAGPRAVAPRSLAQSPCPAAGPACTPD